MKALLTLLGLALSISVFAQRKVVWEEFIRDNSADTSVFEMNTADVLSIYLAPKKVDLDKMPAGRNRDGRLVIDRQLEIQAPKVEIGDGYIPIVPVLALSDLHFTKTVTLALEGATLSIVNCVFEKGLFVQMGLRASSDLPAAQSKYCYMGTNRVQGPFQISTSGDIDVGLNQNSFELDATGLRDDGYFSALTRSTYIKKVMDTLLVNGKEARRFPLCFHLDVTGGDLNVTDNKFSVPDGFVFEFSLYSVPSAEFQGNTFSSDVELNGSVNVGFTLSRNSFAKGISLYDLVIPDHHQIKWKGLGGHIGVMGQKYVRLEDIPAEHYTGRTPLTSDSYSDSVAAEYFYDGRTREELLDKDQFDKLMETYKFLYDSYKGKGNLESSNACFVQAKDLEGRRLSAIYHTEGGFKNFFGWKLNQLMKFYTNHATEPELALVVSVYIIILFSVFYFFFPSEWDVESKSTLIRNYRELMQKNEKGYVRPFFKMLLGFTLSLLNAVTLSLNSFVTLGFGNIPTRGIARYVCIVQGFVGWFLLSIFTVALFNQVLF